MRRKNSAAKKLKLKILEAKKNGMTYEEIRRKYGVSPNTISSLVKGKSLAKYCMKCGETAPEKLEDHHPDRVNYPTETEVLCANCHSHVHRIKRQKGKRDREHNQPTLTAAPSTLSTEKLLPPPGAQKHPYTPVQTPNPVPKFPVDPNAIRVGLAIYGMAQGAGQLADALWRKQQSSGPPSQGQRSYWNDLLDRFLEGGSGVFLFWVGVKLLKWRCPQAKTPF